MSADEAYLASLVETVFLLCLLQYVQFFCQAQLACLLTRLVGGGSVNDLPLDVRLRPQAFLPHKGRQPRGFLKLFVFEGLLMNLPAGFEVLRYADVKMGVGLWGGGLVYDILLVTFASEWAVLSFRNLAVAVFTILLSLVFAQDFPVMRLDYLFDVWCATVCEFESVFV